MPIQLDADTKKLIDDMIELFKKIWEEIKKIAERAAAFLKECFTPFIRYAYSFNGRVLHLALHAKKARTRKKNMRRLVLDYVKYTT